MPRYFFDVADQVVSPDRQGSHFADAATARAQAVVFAGEYLADHPELVADGDQLRVIVRADAGGPVFTVVMLGVESDAPGSEPVIRDLAAARADRLRAPVR